VEGNVISVVEKDESGWWWGRLVAEQGVSDEEGTRPVGMFPCTYVEWCLDEDLRT
jgi:hypothetical protein